MWLRVVKMDENLRNLYKRTLKKKWIPLLKSWNKFHSTSKLFVIGINNRCPFCYDIALLDGTLHCERCKINHKICDNFGKRGYYNGANHLEFINTTKFLKRMIRLLKIEKFKCIFKKECGNNNG